MTKNHTAESLGFAFASGFAGRSGAFGSLGGVGRKRCGRFAGSYRDFVASPSHPCHSH